MKKIMIICLILCFHIIILYSQQKKDTTTTTNTTTDSKDNPTLTANSQITEVRLNGFEDASFWDVSMPIDQGVILRQSRDGAASDVKSEDTFNSVKKRDDKYGIPRTYPREKVLGVKVQYIARGYNWFAIRPVKPIVIEGICQHISFFIVGRNYKHVLKVFVLDYFGRELQLVVDKMNFVGWKELIVPIPDHIIQTDYHFPDKQGIKFNGFLVECDPMEAFGVYYVYFDELRALTDIFNEKTKDEFDISDDW